jgi:hypothetical protein
MPLHPNRDGELNQPETSSLIFWQRKGVLTIAKIILCY